MDDSFVPLVFGFFLNHKITRESNCRQLINKIVGFVVLYSLAREPTTIVLTPPILAVCVLPREVCQY
jgi:hypothetical protein